jgi:SecD/SecF fusion protein
MLFGGETLQDFGFALLVGVASGTYSSVFIAAPVLVHWKEREPIWKRRERIVREDHGGVVPAYADVDLGEGGARRSITRRPRPEPGAAAQQTAPQAGATTTATVVPPDEGGDGVPHDDEPTQDDGGTGDGDGAASKPPKRSQPSRSKQNRRRRKHGRR